MLCALATLPVCLSLDPHPHQHLSSSSSIRTQSVSSSHTICSRTLSRSLRSGLVPLHPNSQSSQTRSRSEPQDLSIPIQVKEAASWYHLQATLHTSNTNRNMATSKPPRRRRQSPLSSSSGTLPSSSRGASRCKCIGIAAAALLSASTVQAQLSQPNPCIRWGHSSTLGASSSNSSAQSTLYIYGGDAKTDTSQTANTRTNALISLDVSTNWSIASPPLKLVEPDSGDDYEPVARTCLGAGFSSADGQSLYCAFYILLYTCSSRRLRMLVCLLRAAHSVEHVVMY